MEYTTKIEVIFLDLGFLVLLRPVALPTLGLTLTENPYTTAPDSIQGSKGVEAGPAISTFYMYQTRMPVDL